MEHCCPTCGMKASLGTPLCSHACNNCCEDITCQIHFLVATSAQFAGQATAVENSGRGYGQALENSSERSHHSAAPSADTFVAVQQAAAMMLAEHRRQQALRALQRQEAAAAAATSGPLQQMALSTPPQQQPQQLSQRERVLEQQQLLEEQQHMLQRQQLQQRQQRHPFAITDLSPRQQQLAVAAHRQQEEEQLFLATVQQRRWQRQQQQLAAMRQQQQQMQRVAANLGVFNSGQRTEPNTAQEGGGEEEEAKTTPTGPPAEALENLPHQIGTTVETPEQHLQEEAKEDLKPAGVVQENQDAVNANGKGNQEVGDFTSPPLAKKDKEGEGETKVADASAETPASPKKKKRRLPSKANDEEQNEEPSSSSPPKKKRGRTPKQPQATAGTADARKKKAQPPKRKKVETKEDLSPKEGSATKQQSDSKPKAKRPRKNNAKKGASSAATNNEEENLSTTTTTRRVSSSGRPQRKQKEAAGGAIALIAAQGQKRRRSSASTAKKQEGSIESENLASTTMQSRTAEGSQKLPVVAKTICVEGEEDKTPGNNDVGDEMKEEVKEAAEEDGQAEEKETHSADKNYTDAQTKKKTKASADDQLRDSTGKEQNEAMTSADDIVEPHDHDVLGGRGCAGFSQHPGNLHLQELVRKRHAEYHDPANRGSKIRICREILEACKTGQLPNGRFLTQIMSSKDRTCPRWTVSSDSSALGKIRYLMKGGHNGDVDNHQQGTSMDEKSKNGAQKNEGLPAENIESLREHDVVIGGGTEFQNHSGNASYRSVIQGKVSEYTGRESAVEMVQLWRDKEPAGRFLQKDAKTGLWNDVGDAVAVEKTMTTFRDARRSRNKGTAPRNAEKKSFGPSPKSSRATSPKFNDFGTCGDRTKWMNDVLQGRTTTQMLAKEKRAALLPKGRFVEPGFMYSGDTIVIWDIFEYNRNPKWREEAIRRSMRRNARSENPQSTVATDSNRFRAWIEDSYQDYLKQGGQPTSVLGAQP